MNLKQNNSAGIERRLMVLIILLSLISAITVSPIGLPALTTRKVEVTAHTEALHEILNMIPLNASVATQNDILPHLAQREKIFILSWPMKMEVDFIIVDLKSFHILYGPTPGSTSPIEALCELVKSGKYGVVACADGILLLGKGYMGSYKVFKPYTERFTYKNLYTLPSTSSIKFDGTSESGNVIIHDINHKAGVVWYGPYAWLYKGNYSATFVVKTASENVNLTLDVLSSEFDLTTNSWFYERIGVKTLNFSDFESLNRWKEFTINFRVEGLKRLEFRGICEFEDIQFELDYIKVIQLGP